MSVLDGVEFLWIDVGAGVMCLNCSSCVLYVLVCVLTGFDGVVVA